MCAAWALAMSALVGRAAVVDAGAAELAMLDEGDLQAFLVGARGESGAGLAGGDDEGVELLGHQPHRSQATSSRPPCQGAGSIYAAAGIVAGLARERARARRSEAPSPRQALPCMQARTWGCSRARRSRVAPVCGACA